MGLGLDKKRIALLEKIVLSGTDTIKKIQALETEQICNIMEKYGMKVSDLREILNLKNEARRGDILEFLKEKDTAKEKEKTDENDNANPRRDRSERLATNNREHAGGDDNQHRIL